MKGALFSVIGAALPHILAVETIRILKDAGTDPIAAVDLIFSDWGDLIETDLADIRQWYAAAEIGVRVVADEQRNVRWIQLEEPYIVRGDTPLEVRGMVPNEMHLHDWMQDCVFDQECEADP